MLKFAVCLCLVFIASPLFAADYLQQGARYLESGNLRSAIRVYERAIKENQESAAAHQGLGLAYYRLGDLQVGYDTEMIAAAVREFKASLEVRANPEVNYHLGLCYLILYQKKKAEEMQRVLAASEPALAERLAVKIAGFVKAPRLEPSTPTLSRTTTEAGAAGVTPVAIVGNTVLVPVTLTYRGNSVQARLVLDTGASVTAISDRLAAQLGVADADTNPMTGVVADGRRVEARWFLADSVGVGPKSASQLRTVILPGSGGPGHDGLLGMDFLRKFRYQVDFDRQIIDWKN
jgi:tetratricopeptide (TPR) repeat protein